MTDNLLQTNYTSPYLKTLITNFDNRTKLQGNCGLPEKQEKIENSSINKTSQKGKKVSLEYYSGLSATILQAIAGILMIPAVFLEKDKNELAKSKINALPQNLLSKDKEKEVERIIENYGESTTERIGKRLKDKKKYKEFAEKIFKNAKNLHRLGRNFRQIGWLSLGISYFVSIPSCIGASLNVKQPSMLLGAAAWAVASPFMMMKKFNDSERLKGFLMLGYALTYMGLANKIKNDNGSEKPIKFDFDNNKDNLTDKTSKIIKFSLKDHLSIPEAVKNSFKQTKDYLSGKRKEIPDFISPNPTTDNRKITSLLLYAGGIPLMIFGKKNKMVEKAANIMIGTGLLFDSIGMFAIGRKEKGATKAVLLGGVPLRAVGDFAQTNKFMYGLRTLGGASFEYYFASLNKDAEKAKEN